MNMRKIRYHVAMSLDGFIAGPHGEADWILSDPEVNFAELWAQFDTLLMGRLTYLAAMSRLGEAAFKGPKAVVVSRTLKPADHPGITIINELTAAQLQSLRTQPNTHLGKANPKNKGKKNVQEKDIWLFGGGALVSTLLEMNQIDTVEVSIMPVLLGAGIPLVRPPAHQTKLKLSSQKIYRSGIVSLVYEVKKPAPKRERSQ
jgi:dihydrofolate reductase